MTNADRRNKTRAERLSMPLARDVVKELAVEHGGCIRPVQLRRTDLTTGQTEPVLVPCGHTLASVCPSCAERAKNLRAAQCREGWHLDSEPVIEPDDPTDEQLWWIETRADAQAMRDADEARGEDVTDWDQELADLDDHINEAGMRGNVLPARNERRHRSTRRRRDSLPLPKRAVDPRTVGKTYTTPDGKTFRPSLFVTLTCPSYGRVKPDGTPADPGSYDYIAAARDALHFAAVFDRFMQNLRRFVGYDVQYFAAVEPQRRLAPHVHIAMRGTVSRAELREVIAATYHQVWWPSTDVVRFDGGHLPVWDEDKATYLDPETGEVLPTWDEALDAIGDDDEPLHVARFGDRFDAQGVLAGSKDANRCIGYLTKYLTKHVSDCHQAVTDDQARHADRLADALRYEPCSPTCANWLRYGVQPKNAKPGMRPGACKGKAHRREYLGYAGRRPRLPQVVRQDPRRPPRRPQKLATRNPRPFGSRPGALRLGTRRTRRPRPHAHWAKTAPRRRRPHPLATGTRPSAQTRPRATRRYSGNRGRGMTAGRLLTVEAAAELLSTSPRFVRRLIAERRIEFVKVGRHVRISEASLSAFVQSGVVKPMTPRSYSRGEVA